MRDGGGCSEGERGNEGGRQMTASDAVFVVEGLGGGIVDGIMCSLEGILKGVLHVEYSLGNTLWIAFSREYSLHNAM